MAAGTSAFWISCPSCYMSSAMSCLLWLSSEVSIRPNKCRENSNISCRQTHSALTSCLHEAKSFLEKLKVTQAVKKSSASYGNRKFITVFTKYDKYCLFWARWIHSTTSDPIFLRSILILPSHLRLGFPSVLFRFPIKILYAFFIFPMRATYPTQFIPL